MSNRQRELRWRMESDNGGRLQVVPVEAKPSSGLPIVEFKAPRAPIREETEEDLEVKLRRIIELVPVRVSNTSGSSAGSGSGDFHQYRQMRRKEQDRVARMEADYQRKKDVREFNIRREERMRETEERTSKKRLKRQKKKMRKRERRTGTDVSHPPPKHRSSSSSSSSSSSDRDGDEPKNQC